MKKYLNKKYITIFSIIIVTILLLGNYFTCPRYLNPIGLDSFDESLVWFKYYKFNSAVIHYSNPLLGEADFGFITYVPILRAPTIPEDVKEISVVVKKINERTCNLLVKGFIINIEGITIFLYPNNTEIQWSTVFFYDKFLSDFSEFDYRIYHDYYYFPKTLYARIDYTVHAIINPYAEIWYSNYKYITTGFHVKVYSGSITIPITIIPE
jgi:hypothetical protein